MLYHKEPKNVPELALVDPPPQLGTLALSRPMVVPLSFKITAEKQNICWKNKNFLNGRFWICSGSLHFKVSSGLNTRTFDGLVISF